MSRTRTLAAVAAALLLSAGCGSRWNSPVIAPIQVNPIVPMAVGNRWTYVDSTFATGTGQLQSVDSSRVEITGREDIRYQGVVCEAYDWTWTNPANGSPDDFSFVVGTAPNGIYEYGGRSSSGLFMPGRLLELRYPVYLNDSWTAHEILHYASRGFVDTTYTYQCSAPDTLLRTPAGMLRCVEYLYTYFFFYSNDPLHSHRSELFIYYRPGVGYVGFVQKLDGVVTASKRLRSYRLVSPAAQVTPRAMPPARAASRGGTTSLWGSRP
jgi:hypothetical protein